MSSVNLSEKTIRLIEDKNFAFIATIMKDGSPQVTPVWIDREGDLMLVNTSVGRVKQKNTKRNPKVAIAITDAVNPYQMVMIRGSVVEQTIKGAEDHIDKLARKYIGKERYPWRTPGMQRIILKIKPEHIYGN